MNHWTDFRVRMVDFFKRNRRKIIIIFSIWIIIIMIEYYLRNNRVIVIDPPSTTYAPFEPVMKNDNTEEVPQQYQAPIQSLIDKYFNYCNNGEYEKAYDLITQECKNKNYPTLDQFTAYVNAVFEGKKKIYNIQSYSIVDNKYIFNIRILDDILANGTSDGYYYYEEKFVLIEENGEIKLSIAEYVGDEKMEVIAEDDYIKVEVVNKSVDYETETYSLRVTNKTDKYMVISDNTLADEILLYVGGVERKPTNMQIALFYIPPKSTRTQNVEFIKYYDEKLEDQEIVFNYVRILDEYDFTIGTTQEQLDNALDFYAFEIPLS